MAAATPNMSSLSAPCWAFSSRRAFPDLKHRRLYSFGKPSDYPTLEPMIAGRINVALIRAHWSEILRIVASIRTGTVTASLIMRQLASYPRQNGVAAALRELGRLERTLFTLDWISDPELRRATGQELNKGESRNSLARAVFIHRLGEIRDRTYENQQHRVSGLNLLVTAIILWNTRYLERAVAALRRIEDVPDHLLAHLSPLGWEHVNLTGDYVWGAAEQMTENTDGLRPLRTPPMITAEPPDVRSLSAYAYQEGVLLVLAKGDMPLQEPGRIVEIVIGPAAPSDAEDFACSLLAPLHSDPRSIVRRSQISCHAF